MRIALRRNDGARVIQLPSGCIPMISECACWAICRIRVLRYASGISSRGSTRRSAAISASKPDAPSRASAADPAATASSNSGVSEALRASVGSTTSLPYMPSVSLSPATSRLLLRVDVPAPVDLHEVDVVLVAVRHVGDLRLRHGGLVAGDRRTGDGCGLE